MSCLFPTEHTCPSCEVASVPVVIHDLPLAFRGGGGRGGIVMRQSVSIWKFGYLIIEEKIGGGCNKREVITHGFQNQNK